MKQNNKEQTKSNNKFKWIISNWFIAIIQLIASLVITYSVFKLQVLPTKYLIIFYTVLILGNLLYFFLLFNNKKKWRNLGKVLSVLISLAMFTGSFYALNTAGFIKGITGGKFDTHMVSVITLKDHEASKIGDLQFSDFAYNQNVDEEYVTETFSEIESMFKKEVPKKAYANNDELVQALYDKKEEAILISESQRNFIEEVFESFDEDTKIVYSKGHQVAVDINVNKPPVNVLKDTYTIFISGIDTYGPVTTVSRSDVNMLMTVNPQTNQILLTSIPRDYFVTLGTKGKKDKLTHAGNYGVEESVLTLEKVFDINIDYYVKVNFSSLTKIVDALGGITVQSRFNFTSGAGQKITKGPNNMNGTQTLAFVRERYNLPSGDNDRILNQQAALTGILQKAMSPAIILNYTSFLASINGSFVMSMPEKDFQAIIKHQVDTMAEWDIKDQAVSGTGMMSTNTFSMPGRNLYVMEPNQESVQNAHNKIQAMERGERID